MACPTERGSVTRSNFHSKERALRRFDDLLPLCAKRGVFGRSRLTLSGPRDGTQPYPPCSAITSLASQARHDPVSPKETFASRNVVL
jgi:hypothetical protein